MSMLTATLPVRHLLILAQSSDPGKSQHWGVINTCPDAPRLSWPKVNSHRHPMPYDWLHSGKCILGRICQSTPALKAKVALWCAIPLHLHIGHQCQAQNGWSPQKQNANAKHIYVTVIITSLLLILHNTLVDLYLFDPN